MDLTRIKEIKNLLKKNNVRPIKSLGQHFLVSREVLDTMVETADLSSGDAVLEVGPGLGVLTRELAERAGAVFACEKDPGMARILVQIMGKRENVKIHEGDVLSRGFRIEFTRWLQKQQSDRYKIVSNLPYSITSFFLRSFLTFEPRPTVMVLLIQKEVAQRVVADPPHMSLLSLSVQSYAKPKLIKTVSRKEFYPVPEVNSAIIYFDLGKGFLKRKKVDQKKFFRLLKIAFSSKRKTLYNNLSNALSLTKDEIRAVLEKHKFSEKIRAQELSLKDWFILYQAWNHLL